MKTSELNGKALDWAVAKCEGIGVEIKFHRTGDKSTMWMCADSGDAVHWYSRHWAQGGPIIEQESISLNQQKDSSWTATRIEGSSISEEDGPTPLIAAMRCYVASCFGKEIQVPEELNEHN